jgi:hypothetical protein
MFGTQQHRDGTMAPSRERLSEATEKRPHLQSGRWDLARLLTAGFALAMTGKQQGYFNLRGYWEYWAQKRLEGYALFATINLPFGQ